MVDLLQCLKEGTGGKVLDIIGVPNPVVDVVVDPIDVHFVKLSKCIGIVFGLLNKGGLVLMVSQHSSDFECYNR